MPSLPNLVITSTHADHNTSLYGDPSSITILVPSSPEIVTTSAVSVIDNHATFTLPSGFVLFSLPLEFNDLSGTSQYSTTIYDQIHKGTGSPVSLSVACINPSVATDNVLVAINHLGRVTVIKCVDLKHYATGF